MSNRVNEINEIPNPHIKPIPKPNIIKKVIKGKALKKTLFSLDNLGRISLAKTHASANRPLHKINEFTNEVIFCPCCNLPQETKGIIEPFHYCDEEELFAECGIGTYLYFYYFKYAIIILIITLCMSALPFLILTSHYTKGLNRLCNNYFDEYGNVNDYKSCEKFVSHSSGSQYYQNDTDWALKYSSDNIKSYREVFKEFTGNDEVDNVLVNYSVVNFFCLMTLFVVNIVFIILVKAKGKEVDINNTSPSDYTVLCVNLNNALDAYNYYKEYPNMKYIDEVHTDAEKFNLFLLKELLISNSNEQLNIESINLCYKLDDFMELENKLNEINKKIFEIENNPNQRKLNLQKHKKVVTDMSYYSGSLCCKSEISYIKLTEEREKIKIQIKRIIDDREKLTKENFAGCLFVTFKTIEDAEKFYDEFPQSFLSKLWVFLKNLRYYICCCCYSKEEINRFHRRKKMKVYHAPEPEDIIWENLEFTSWNRFQKSLIIYGISIFLIGITVGIVVALTYLQNKSNKNNSSENTFIKYGISLVITGVISFINMIFQWILDYLTKLEHQRTKTEYYLSFSVKLTIFTFVNSAVVPLIGNYIQDDWGENENLVNNMITMFISNAFLTPILWTFNIGYIIKRVKISFLEKKENPDSKHNMSQRDLNLLYEHPSMDISYKYSYIGKTLLMTFLYIPIFPLGVPISLCGFLLGYFLEKYNFTHIYKRPEMLNHKICEFYMNYFIVLLFDYGIGNWMFMSETFPIKQWALVNIILFGILIIIPYPHLFNCNFINYNESEINTRTYKDVYFSFYNDYERQNPLTKKQGLTNYLKRLYDNGKITLATYNFAKKNVEQLNLMQMYYKTSLSSNLIQSQKALANSHLNITKNNFGKYIQKSFLNNNQNKNDVEGVEIKNYKGYNYPTLDQQILMAFGGGMIKEAENENDKEENYQNGNFNQMFENNNNIVNQYNNPFLLNMGHAIGFGDFMNNNYFVNDIEPKNNYNNINFEPNNIINNNIDEQGYSGGGGFIINNNSNLPFNNVYIENDLNKFPIQNQLRYKSSPGKINERKKNNNEEGNTNDNKNNNNE